MKPNFTSLEFPLYESPMKERNEDKYGHLSFQCICCFKPMADGESKMVHMNTNWNAMDISIIEENDAEKHDFESQGYFHIGNSCAKKMPQNFIHDFKK
jgi:hypothetical protein